MTIPARSRRRLVAAAAVMLAFGCLAMPTARADSDVTIALLNINDFHGQLDGGVPARLSATIEGQRIAYGAKNTLLLSAGDNYGFSPFSAAVQDDQPTIDILNALGLLASAVGNHEFDHGFADLTDRVIGTEKKPNAAWTFLGANVYRKGTTTPVLPEYKVFDVGGVSVGVIGAVTAWTTTSIPPVGIAGLDFGDPVAAVNRVAARLSDGNPDNGEAQVLVAEYHDGATVTSDLAAAEQASSTFAAIVDDTSPLVDVIFTGHTHQAYAWTDTRGRPVLQAGSRGQLVGKVELHVDSSGTVRSAVPSLLNCGTASASAGSAKVIDLTDAAVSYAATKGASVVGTLTGDVTAAFSGGSYGAAGYAGGTRGDRTQESSLGTFVADATRAGIAGTQAGIATPRTLGSDLLVAASGSRAAETISYAEAYNAVATGNIPYATTMSGAVLRTALEQQWQSGASTPSARLGLSSNLTYSYDPDAAAGHHVTGIWLDGTAVTDAGSYRIAVLSARPGAPENGFTALDQGSRTAVSPQFDTLSMVKAAAARSPLAPDYAKHGVGVVAPRTAIVGGSYTLKVSDLDATSLGAPRTTSLQVRVGGTLVTTVPVSNGTAGATITVPRAGAMVLTALPSATTIRVPVVILGATATSVRLSGIKVAYGRSLTATVTVRGGGSGSVRLDYAGRSTVAHLRKGSASVKLANDLPVGSRRLLVSYLGTATAAASTAAPVGFVVTKAIPVPIGKNAKGSAVAARGYATMVRTKALGKGVWASGTLTTYVDGTQVSTTSLAASYHGAKKVSVPASALQGRRRGTTVTVITRLTASDTTAPATLKKVKLRLR